MGGKTVQPAWVQGSWRYENDDGTLDGSTFIAAENTSITQDADANFRLRISWGESANQTVGTSLTPALQFNINGGTWTTVTTATACKATTSTNETDGNTSTTGARVTAPTGCATFIDATFDEDNTLAARTPTDDWYEISFNLQLDSASLTDADTINFQLIDGAASVTFGTRDTPLPSLTVNIPAGVDDLTADSLSTPTELGKPVISEINVLTSDSLSVVTENGKPTISQVFVLLADSLSTPTETGKPVLVEIQHLTASSLSVQTELGRPTLAEVGTVDVLLADSLSVPTEVGKPVITEVFNLLADSLSIPTESGKPSITEVHVLVADSLSVPTELGQPSITEVHILTASSLSVTTELGKPTLAEVVAGVDNLIADSLSVVTELGKPTISEVPVVIGDHGGGGSQEWYQERIVEERFYRDDQDILDISSIIFHMRRL